MRPLASSSLMHPRPGDQALAAAGAQGRRLVPCCRSAYRLHAWPIRCQSAAPKYLFRIARKQDLGSLINPSAFTCYCARGTPPAPGSSRLT
jgi:hypothetical protein